MRPWPLPDGQFHEVFANDVIEHLENAVGTMEGIHRVCVPNAAVRVTVPTFRALMLSQTRRTGTISGGSFQLLSRASMNSLLRVPAFPTQGKEMIFYLSLLNKIVWRATNRWPAASERRWTWMFPAWFISFELEVVKVM